MYWDCYFEAIHNYKGNILYDSSGCCTSNLKEITSIDQLLEILTQMKESKAITVKPVITFDHTNELVSGKGTEEDPYIIEKHKVKTLADAYVSNIVKINDVNYKIIEILEDKVKLTSIEPLMKNDELYETKFGGSTSAYKESNTVGTYLNNT